MNPEQEYAGRILRDREADARIAIREARRYARELPFGSLRSLKKRAMNPDVRESLISPERLFNLIDCIEKHSVGFTKNLLRIFGVDVDDLEVEDDDELCWLQLWATARERDIDSDYFWEFMPREVAAVLNHNKHLEEECRKLRSEKQKCNEELWDAQRKVRSLSFSARLQSTALPLPDESVLTVAPNLERPRRSSGLVQADSISQKNTTKQPTAARVETGGQRGARRQDIELKDTDRRKDIIPVPEIAYSSLAAPPGELAQKNGTSVAGRSEADWLVPIPEECWDHPELWLLSRETEANRASTARLFERQRNLLERLGSLANPDSDEEVRIALDAAARVAGIELKDTDTRKDIISVLEIAYSSLAAPVGKLAQKNDVRVAGRPGGTLVASQKLKELRGPITQTDLAEKSGLSLNTIQRGERGETWSEETFSAVADALTMMTGRSVGADDLKNPQ